jgi:GWxTD domain-containing protein
MTVTLTARVLTETGSLITAASPEGLTVGAEGGVAARTLNLTGLPPGSYRLEVTAEHDGAREVREAAFEMAGFETEAAIAAATRSADLLDPFADLTESRLDSLYAPTAYLQQTDERGVYDGLTVEGKRIYLRRFWERRDPSPGTPDNEFREGYYRLFAEANRRFRESGSGVVLGWRTDRGRVFLKRGEPEEVLRRPSFGQNVPYEVWKYTRPQQLKYLFLDQVGLGQYQLVYTNDRFETSRGDWRELLTAEAIDDVLRF